MLLRVLATAIALVLPGLAFAQCPAEGKIDANRATARQLEMAGVDRNNAAVIVTNRPFNGYSDLSKLAEDQGFVLPGAFAVCAVGGVSGNSSGAHVESAGSDEAAAINVNSANASDLAGLRSCNLDPIVLAKRNESGTSFATNSAFLNSIRSPLPECRTMLFKLGSRQTPFPFSEGQ